MQAPARTERPQPTGASREDPILLGEHLKDYQICRSRVRFHDEVTVDLHMFWCLVLQMCLHISSRSAKCCDKLRCRRNLRR
jgi:hypothetical protein